MSLEKVKAERDTMVSVTEFRFLFSWNSSDRFVCTMGKGRRFKRFCFDDICAIKSILFSKSKDFCIHTEPQVSNQTK